MFAWNEDQEKRQLDYSRYRKLTLEGYSISSHVSAREALYVINTDPFGRAYYLKPLGEIVQTERVTGREYLVEGWSVKEFIVDNKVQLINKVSSDLLVGNPPDITLKGAPEKLQKWLEEEVIKPEKLYTKLLEGAVDVSALGEIFLMPYVKDSRIRIKIVFPEFVDVKFDDEGDVVKYVYAWELEDVPTGNARVDRMLKRSKSFRKERDRTKLLRVKEFYKGRIEHSIFLVRGGKIESSVSMETIEPELYALAESDKNKRFQFKTDESEYVDIPSNTIIEYTGVDEFLFVHWPNYKLLRWWGQSDNAMVESLQNALNNRETQLNDVLDKHADPAMYGPQAFLDEEGNLRMSGGGGRYFGVEPDEVPPSYLTWDGHIEEVHAEIKRLYKAICDNAEVSMALTGMEEGGIESGRALMYRLIRSLAMKARKAEYLKSALEELIRTVQKLKVVFLDGNEEDITEEPMRDWEGKVFPVEIKLKNNLPNDVEENVKMVAGLVSDGILSKKTALRILAKYLEEIEPEEEAKNLAEERKAEAVESWKALGVTPVEEGEEEEVGTEEEE